MKTRILSAFLAALAVVSLGSCKGKPKADEQTLPPANAVAQAIVVFEGVAPEDEVMLKDLLRVDGVLVKGTQYIVAINGQVCNVGENLKLTANSRTYNLKILSIENDRILVSAVQR